jgi:hypothetical protein
MCNGELMERKNLNAILANEFEDFIKEIDLFQDYISGKILCSECNSPITKENISMIFYRNGFLFLCDNADCLRKME